MTTFLELAKQRHSVRKYLPDKIPDDVLARILESGRLAPSGNNSQPWRFIVVKDDGMKKKLYDVCGKQSWILEAPVSIAVVGDITAKMERKLSVGECPSINDPKNNLVLVKTVRDAAIATDHIVMAATDEGLGSCWIALFDQDDIKSVLGCPDSCYVVAVITVGKSAVTPRATPRHKLNEIVFENKYGLSLKFLTCK